MCREMSHEGYEVPNPAGYLALERSARKKEPSALAVPLMWGNLVPTLGPLLSSARTAERVKELLGILWGDPFR